MCVFATVFAPPPLPPAPPSAPSSQALLIVRTGLGTAKGEHEMGHDALYYYYYYCFHAIFVWNIKFIEYFILL